MIGLRGNSPTRAIGLFLVFYVLAAGLMWLLILFVQITPAYLPEGNTEYAQNVAGWNRFALVQGLWFLCTVTALVLRRVPVAVVFGFVLPLLTFFVLELPGL